MKKMFFTCPMVVVAILALVCVFCGPAGAADVIKLNFQGKWMGHEKENWAAEQLKLAEYVKAATNGKIQITNMDEVVKDNEVIDGVRMKVIDMGCQGLFSRRELQVVNFITLPFVPDAKVQEIMDKLKPTFEDVWDKQLGVKQLGYAYFLPQRLYTKKPAATLEELKTMKLRINGNILIQLYKLAGASPITMDLSEVYTSLQRGLIDGAQTAIPGYISSALYESAKYMSNWPLGVSGMGLVMNKDAWSKLDPTLQGQLMSAVQTFEKAQIAGIAKDVEALEQKAVSLGGIPTNPSEAERNKLLAFAGPVIKDWKEKSGPNGEIVLKTINDVLGTDYK